MESSIKNSIDNIEDRNPTHLMISLLYKLYLQTKK